MQKKSVFSDFYCLPNKLALTGLSPGLACAMEKSRRDDLKSYRNTVRETRNTFAGKLVAYLLAVSARAINGLDLRSQFVLHCSL
jgi:hypothetical protein